MQPGRVTLNREARICLIGLAGLRALLVGLIGVLWQQTPDAAESLGVSAGWFAGGLALGWVVTAWQRHPRRVLGFVPWGSLGLTILINLWAADGDAASNAVCALIGIAAGLINFPLARAFRLNLAAEVRMLGMAIRLAVELMFVGVSAGLLIVLAQFADLSPLAQLWLLGASAAVATLAAAWLFRREIVEQLIEVIFAVMYRFRAAGPGLATFPVRGPVIVVANHSGYLDPMWLAKVLPRTIIPMMTAYFFDVWWMRWAMIYIADAIRVELPKFRRGLPDLSGPIAALDDGKCLVIFPEGRLRRTEERPLSMFGQGVWHILRERPNTPVVVCWIEGGWGSYVSYWNGLPMKNKRFDIRHPISIGVHEPEVLNAEILADQRRTRRYLMERCAAARAFLGLEPVKVGCAEVEAAEEPA